MGVQHGGRKVSNLGAPLVVVSPEGQLDTVF